MIRIREWLDRLLIDWKAKIVLLIVLLVGIFCIAIDAYFISPFISDNSDKNVTIPELFVSILLLIREVGMACLIAVFLALIIEFYSTRKLQSETTQHAIEALFRRTLPQSIWKELIISVFPEKAVRKELSMVMNIEAGYDSSVEYISTTTLSFYLDGLTEYMHQYTLKGELFRQEIGKDNQGKRVPRYIHIKVGEKTYDENDSSLSSILKDDDFQFEIPPFLIKEGVNLPISIKCKEKITVPNTYVHVFPNLTENITFELQSSESLGLQLVVEALHPVPERMKYEDNKWEFVGGFITGQGIKINTFK